MPMQTATGALLETPLGDINCEMDNRRAEQTSAYCQTGTPPRSVTGAPLPELLTVRPVTSAVGTGSAGGAEVVQEDR